jgi:hypothetical protein
MIRTGRIRTLLAVLLLGSALSLPGLQLAQDAVPQVVHAAPVSQVGPVLAGNWVNYAKGARFADLQITAVTSGPIGSALPTSITYGVNVFSVSENRFVAFGTSAPVPFTAGGLATIPLTALPTPSRFFHTTITLALLTNSSIEVAITDFSSLTGTRYSKELMYRP